MSGRAHVYFVSCGQSVLVFASEGQRFSIYNFKYSRVCFNIFIGKISALDELSLWQVEHIRSEVEVEYTASLFWDFF